MNKKLLIFLPLLALITVLQGQTIEESNYTLIEVRTAVNGKENTQYFESKSQFLFYPYEKKLITKMDGMSHTYYLKFQDVTDDGGNIYVTKSARGKDMLILRGNGVYTFRIFDAQNTTMTFYSKTVSHFKY